MNDTEVHAALERSDALLHGHFQLSSGRHSDTYVQCALVLQHPGIAERLGHELGTRLSHLEPTVVVGPAMGGLIIAHEVARFLNVRMIFTERVDGRMTLRRGFQLGSSDRVLVIEDVVTTGGSPREVIDLIRENGAQPVGVGAIIDRANDVSFGVPFASLLQLRVASWEPDACALCARGEPLDSPGSRRVAG